MTTHALSPGLSSRDGARSSHVGTLTSAGRAPASRSLETPAYVKHYDRQLSHLDDWLAIIALVGKVASRSGGNGVLDRVTEVQDRFRLLRVQLAEALIEEHAREYEMVLGGRAAIAVDMLVRNLFERSADIGFLSTDSTLCAYMESQPGEIDIQQHLARYIAKYSVYDDVMLLDIEGTLRTSLNCPEGNSLCDAALQQTLLELGSGYIEYFAPTSLAPHLKQALLFIAPIVQGESNKRLGYLALSFHLDEEVRGIFEEVADGAFELALLDSHGRVVASSLPSLALNASLYEIGASGVDVMMLDGKHYACRQVTGSPYQGYEGLGWRCLALTELSKGALVKRNAHTVSAEVEVVKGKLSSIRYQASMIAQQLNLAVINGHIVSVRHKALELVPVLNQIREVGILTDRLFEESISTLSQGMSLTAIADASMRAFSMVSIMDRNLYERANDVRWWALDERIRRQLSPASTGDEQARRKLSEVIGSINRLYTVYTNILVFDQQGVIIAVSDSNVSSLVGTHVPEALPLAACLTTDSDQGYVVSALLESVLYAGGATYLYCAPVMDFTSHTIVGGIVTVFDATPEFRQILADNLPAGGAPLPPPFALFVDAEGQLISSTLPNISLPLLLGESYAEALSLRNGERCFKQLEFEGNRYLSAMVASTGYREYKRSDHYRNDVIAIACLPII
ncbi:cache domain-containing protein [Vreelandella titanicae]|uniref:Chemotaxis protein CheW n=1 Tax=Vreelandella titanicae TaxID=664683 RepID=A0A558JDK5_9GAMM|nr:cache domain-containing protein [Halomonas titanicae]TVU91721.1 hypothetical protein FQP89_00880 [Halomonas titanicae]